MSTWWHDHNAYWRAHPDESTENPCFPDHLVSLLDAVEACFVAAGGSSAWPDPHADPSSPGGCSAPTDDEYSRLTHPERYVISRFACGPGWTPSPNSVSLTWHHTELDHCRLRGRQQHPVPPPTRVALAPRMPASMDAMDSANTTISSNRAQWVSVAKVARRGRIVRDNRRWCGWPSRTRTRRPYA